MRLSEYLMRNNIRPVDFAAQIEVKSRMTLHRYLVGNRVPSPAIMKRIETATKGAVTRADFEHHPLGLPSNDDSPFDWSRCAKYENRRVDRLLRKMLGERQEHETFSAPLRAAIETLDGRVTTDQGRRKLWLDGKPVSAVDLVRRANDIRCKRRQPLIRYPIANPITD